MKRIMACIDLAEPPRYILDTAAEMAQVTGAQLFVVHVVVAPALATCSGNVSSAVAEDLENHLRLARNKLDALSRQLHQELGIDVVALLLEGSKASASLLTEAQRVQPDLIVLGSGRKAAESRVYPGATIQGLLGQTQCPLLVVPSTEVRSTGAPREAGAGRAKAGAWFG